MALWLRVAQTSDTHEGKMHVAVMTRRPVGRSAIVLWERDPMPTVTALDLLDGRVPGYQPQDDDFDLAELVLRYNYFTAAQAEALWELNNTSAAKPRRLGIRLNERLRALYSVGALDRAWVRYRPKAAMTQMGNKAKSRQDFVGEWVYAVSLKGMEFLCLADSEWAVQWRADWTPKSHGHSRKLSIEHELGRNDVALALMAAAAARGRPCQEWQGSREAYHRVAPPTPGAPWQHVEPDGVILLDTGRPLLLEYERSGRADKFLRKVRAMRMYLASGAWRERYVLSPWVVYAIPTVTRTERRYAGSFGDLAAQTRATGAARYLLLDEVAWEGGAWEAVDADGQYVPFWDTVWKTT